MGSALASLEPWLQIALFLLYVRKTQTPDWHPYVASLPEPETPLSWSEDELEELAGTQLYTTLQGYRQGHTHQPVYHDILACFEPGLVSTACHELTTLQACRQFFKGLYSKLQANVFERDPALFSKDVFTFDNMVWAVQIVRSHVHGPLEGKDVALVPIADLVRSAPQHAVHLHPSQTSCQIRAQDLPRSCKHGIKHLQPSACPHMLAPPADDKPGVPFAGAA